MTASLLNTLTPELLSNATPAEQKLIERALELELALSSPLEFAQYVSPGTKAYPHLKLLDDIIVALIEHRLYKDGPGLQGVKDSENMWKHPTTGEPCLLKLAISMPPRHGKSYLVSEHLPAWFLCRYPEKRFMLTAYEADFAATWGRKARTLIEEHPEFGVTTDQESRAAARWDISGHRGGMVTAGMGGAITGKGADVGLIDDPLKNAEEATQATTRDAQEAWWHSTFYNRRQPGGDAVFILMATRWHEDDLTGRMTTAEEGWYVLNLPALAFDDVNEEGLSIDIEQGDKVDPLGRRPGEALCPQFFSATQLLELKESPTEGGRTWFNAQYQGRPTIDGGTTFRKEDFRYHTKVDGTYALETDQGVVYVNEKQCFRFLTVDLAASTKTSADWTVFSAWDAAPEGRIILVDRYRERMESPDHLAQLIKFVQGLGGPKVRFIGVENSTYGLTLITQLQRTPGNIVRKLDPDKDKISRSIPAGAAIMNHQVFFPKNALWRPVWEYELCKFPNSTKDDQVDTLSYAIDVWTDLPKTLREPKKEAVTLQERVEEHAVKLSKRKTGRVRAGMLGRW
jgi:predicted phage terminase large subunit-like protein